MGEGGEIGFSTWTWTWTWTWAFKPRVVEDRNYEILELVGARALWAYGFDGWRFRSSAQGA